MGNYYETFDPPFFPDLNTKYKQAVNLKSYERDDFEIMDDLAFRFSTLQGIDTTKVKYSSKGEVVTLSGKVESERVRAFLVNVAENILGVRGVVCEIKVEHAGASRL